MATDLLKRSMVFPVLGYAHLRSLHFWAQYATLNILSYLIPGNKKLVEVQDKKTAQLIQQKLSHALKTDVENITNGMYPLSVLAPESVTQHFLRIPKIMRDGLSLSLRRTRGQTTKFEKEAQELLEDVPRYYRRNFHFQTDGYLSQLSAELYEHQVEMLFSGSADAMRRLILPPLKQMFPHTDGAGLVFLEVGAGTGRTTRFVRLTFPKAKIICSDLSEPYLKEAQLKLKKFHRIDYMQADSAKLPFQSKQCDAVYSVFLFHELPLKERQAVIEEAHRVLKPGGFFGCVDSIQRGDIQEFDSILPNFPMNYHEPFYHNYLEHPIEELIGLHFKKVKTSMGFLSKVCGGIRN